jgi:hypothetical protein
MRRAAASGGWRRAVRTVHELVGNSASRWVLISAAGVLAGCASVPSHADAGSVASAASATGPVQVLVRNDNPSDVVVYAYRGDLRFRVGEVVAHSSGLVTVPSGIVNEGHVGLMIHQISGGDFFADEVPISAGIEHAELHVLRVLDESSVTVVPGRMH